MKDRDGNETGHMHRAQTNPDTPRPEQVVSPLTTEDYGSSAELQYIARLLRTGHHIVTAIRKVDTDGRYVVEFQVVKRGSATPGLDGQSPGDGVI